MMLTFTAKKMSSCDIQKNDNTNTGATIVKLDEKNIFDKLAIKHAKRIWGYGNYMHGIVCDFSKHRQNEQKNREFLAMTLQKNNPYFLNPFKLLGCVEISYTKSDCAYLDYIQVNPKYTASNKDRKYKHIGEKLLNYIKDKVIISKMYLSAAPTAIEFYAKQGFYRLPDNIMIYIKK